MCLVTNDVSLQQISQAPSTCKAFVTSLSEFCCCIQARSALIQSGGSRVRGLHTPQTTKLKELESTVTEIAALLAQTQAEANWVCHVVFASPCVPTAHTHSHQCVFVCLAVCVSLCAWLCVSLCVSHCVCLQGGRGGADDYY